MDCSTPGFPVLHHLPEFAQTHVHRATNAIQPSHPLSSLSPPAFHQLHDIKNKLVWVFSYGLETKACLQADQMGMTSHWGDSL